jgi:hypothetical protein
MLCVSGKKCTLVGICDAWTCCNREYLGDPKSRSLDFLSEIQVNFSSRLLTFD